MYDCIVPSRAFLTRLIHSLKSHTLTACPNRNCSLSRGPQTVADDKRRTAPLRLRSPRRERSSPLVAPESGAAPPRRPEPQPASRAGAPRRGRGLGPPLISLPQVPPSPGLPPPFTYPLVIRSRALAGAIWQIPSGLIGAVVANGSDCCWDGASRSLRFRVRRVPISVSCVDFGALDFVSVTGSWRDAGPGEVVL